VYLHKRKRSRLIPVITAVNLPELSMWSPSSLLAMFTSGKHSRINPGSMKGEMDRHVFDIIIDFISCCRWISSKSVDDNSKLRYDG
jgi:hypothetical protein